MKKSTIIWVILALLIVSIFFNVSQRNSKTTLYDDNVKLSKQNRDLMSMIGIGQLGTIHIHADFKVYVNGQAIDFSQQKYQVRVQYVHVEDNDGDVVHVHAPGMTLGIFLNSLGFHLTSSCLTTDDGTKMCNSGSKTLKVYVNGKQIQDGASYEIKDLDKILVSYGSETDAQVQTQLKTITNKAKLSSGQEMGLG